MPGNQTFKLFSLWVVLPLSALEDPGTNLDGMKISDLISSKFKSIIDFIGIEYNL